MNLKVFFSRQSINSIIRFNGRFLSTNPYCYRHVSTITAPISHPIHSPGTHPRSPLQNPNFTNPIASLSRFIHSAAQETILNSSAINANLDSDDSEEDDGTMNEFLSRFVWIMRGKLTEVYTDYDKKTIDAMLLIIVGKVVSEMEKGGLEQMLGTAAATPSDDFSEDLWRTVWEVSNKVLEDMEKAAKKEKMKTFLQSEDVKEMCKFAGEAGIRGDLLRELRFKWAREKMEESEFYQSLERLREEEAKESESVSKEAVENEKENQNESEFAMGDEEKAKFVSLPTRHGKIKYKIYGLDLSDPKWAEVADKIHETGEIIWPQEPKPISGKCKIVTDKILSLGEEDDPSPLLAEWVELLEPSRIDWINLLDQLKEKNTRLYFKVAETILTEESFQTNIRDYSKLIDAHAKGNRLEDAEKILKKMNENGILPDILTYTIMIHMYSKSGNLDRANQALDSLRSQGFQPDIKVYNSMIMAYVNANKPKSGEMLLREMEARDIKPTNEIYMALLRSFAQRGDVNEAQRISITMQFDGIQLSSESCGLLVEAYGKSGNPDQARYHFDYMNKLGFKPDDRCTASMIEAYEKKNDLDKALSLLLELEKDGFELGVMTYTVLLDWLCQLQLVDEAEQVLGKIAELGEAPPYKVHVSLCEMYLMVGAEKKALQALGIVEAKNDELGHKDFERVINALRQGGFLQDAQRVRGLMEARGFKVSEALSASWKVSRTFNPKRPMRR